MKDANLYENEKVQIVNINNGERFETYVIKGPYGKGDICLNGAAARLVQPKDKLLSCLIVLLMKMRQKILILELFLLMRIINQYNLKPGEHNSSPDLLFSLLHIPLNILMHRPYQSQLLLHNHKS